MDSIIIREYIRGDTVYRDRWHERCSERLLLRTDTVYQTREVVVRSPPERYTPPPVKYLAWIGAIALFLLILRLLFRLLKYLK